VIRNVATLPNVNRFAWMQHEEVNVYLNVRNTLVIETAATLLLLNVNKNVLHQPAEVNASPNVESMKVIKNVATLPNVNRFAWMLQEEANVYLNVRNTLVIGTAVILQLLSVNKNV